MASGRTLTISLDGDVLALERLERKFVMEIVDQIEEYVEANPGPPSPKVKTPVPAVEPEEVEP